MPDGRHAASAGGAAEHFGARHLDVAPWIGGEAGTTSENVACLMIGYAAFSVSLSVPNEK